MTTPDGSEFDAGFEVPKRSFIKWGKPGDVIKGTLTARSAGIDKWGKKGMTYEFIADEGSFHHLEKDPKTAIITVDEIPTALTPGNLYSFSLKEKGASGKTLSVFMAMEQVKIGQRFLVRFSAWFGENAKTLEVKIGAMNQEWIDAQASVDESADNVTF